MFKRPFLLHFIKSPDCGEKKEKRLRDLEIDFDALCYVTFASKIPKIKKKKVRLICHTTTQKMM